jgi:hypothetical protein
MSSEKVPPSAPPPSQIWARWGQSGKLLVIGAVVGIIAVFLPLVSMSVTTSGFGGFALPGMPSGEVTVNNASASVINDWRGVVDLLAYAASLVFAFILYPPRQQRLVLAALGTGGVAVVLALWLLIAAMRAGSGIAVPVMSYQVSVGIGAYLNFVGAGLVATGAVLKAREEKVV